MKAVSLQCNYRVNPLSPAAQSKRAYRVMFDGWSGNFRRNVMPLINEDIFLSQLYLQSYSWIHYQVLY